MSNQHKSDQRERLRNALRENLKRRKAQAKGRADTTRPGLREAPDARDRTEAGDSSDQSGKS